MEGTLSFFRMHWDHNRCRAGARRGVAPRAWLSALRFMERLLSPLHMPWDPEPTPNPSQEGNWHDADECLLPPGRLGGRSLHVKRHSAAANRKTARVREIAVLFNRPTLATYDRAFIGSHRLPLRFQQLVVGTQRVRRILPSPCRLRRR